MKIDPASIKMKPLEWLSPYEKNTRLHTPEQIRQLRGHIEHYGWTYPILADEKGEIIAGHRRFFAASLDPAIDPVPVLVVAGWPEAKKRAYRIWDNKSTVDGTWDEAMLKIEFTDLAALGGEIAFAGFSSEELNPFGLGDVLGLPSGSSQSSPPPHAPVSLAERFGAVPFSVLNAREGWWQERKKSWIALGIQSELGRGENLLKMSDTVLEPNPEKRKAMQAARAARKGAK